MIIPVIYQKSFKDFLSRNEGPDAHQNRSSFNRGALLFLNVDSWFLRSCLKFLVLLCSRNSMAQS